MTLGKLLLLAAIGATMWVVIVYALITASAGWSL